ncbi:MAG: hypothetical protein CMJ19_03535 [Phycisphaeraceae bacterium]|nr:hypothetical protein [Phycisphaeraceae bacterium]
MKHSTHFLPYLFLFWVGLGIGNLTAQDQTPALKPDAYEPNDKIQQATLVAFEQPIKLNFHTANDIDRVKFEVKEPGLVTWTLTNWKGKGKLPYLYFCDDKGQAIKNDDAGNLYVKTPGVYSMFLHAHQYSWERKPVDEPFELTMHFKAYDDPTEPNDSIKTATPITFGQPLALRFMSRADADFLSFQTPGPGVVQLQFDKLNKKILPKNPYVIWYDTQNKPNDKGYYDYRITEKGTHHLRLISSYYSWELRAHQEPFEVKLTFHPCEDETEPNDTFKTARAINFDQPATMRLRPFNDVDMLKIQVPSRGLVTCTTENWDTKTSGKKIPNFIFYNSDGKKVVDGKPQALLEEGTHYIRVNSAYYNWELRSIYKPFDVTVRWKPEGDDLEPNNDFASATPVEFQKPYTINIIPEFDLDIFKLVIDKPTYVNMTHTDYKAPKGKPQFPYVYYYKPDGTGLQPDKNGVVKLNKGTYYAEVSTHSYSWERTFTTEKFNVVFHLDATPAQPDATQQPSRSADTVMQNQESVSTPATTSRRQTKPGVWIFEVEMIK